MQANKRVLCAVLAVSVFAFSFSGAGQSASQKEKAEEKAKEIPLKSVYATTGQEDVKRIDRNDGAYGRPVSEIIMKWESGASNVFLVRGNDIAAAIKSTLLVVRGARPVDTPIGPEDLVRPEDQTKHDSIWMVAYLGIAGSGPPAWHIAGVERRGNTIRLTYSKPDRFESTRNMHRYLAWAPLGKLQPGSYTLELFDGRKGEISLLRRVTVEELSRGQT